MTYNEWRDELKSNLLCVSESERRRVLDYYAEAYADRREAGFSEREIIDDFGAPYDAAQRILSADKNDGYYDDFEAAPEQTRREKKREERERRREEQAQRGGVNYSYAPPPPPAPAPAPATANSAPAAARTDYTWVFVLLCILFAAPLFGLIMTMVGITIGLCCAPIVVIGSGATVIGSAIGSIFSGEVAYGLYKLGGGIIVLGIGIVLCPLFFKLVGLMWKVFKMFFSWLKSLFSGKERV